MPLSHPTTVADEQPEGFVDIEHTMCADGWWHFALALPEDTALAPEADCCPSPAQPTESLATFQLVLSAPATAPQDEQPETAEIEVLGHLLEDEIDAADWLERALENDGYQIVSRAHVRGASGTAGDVVARWQLDGEPFAGRFVATKWGPRLFVLCCRSREHDYEAFAASFMEAIATFDVLDRSLGVYAEHVELVELSAPRPWQLLLPESWKVRLHPETPEGAYFEAEHETPTPADMHTRALDGRLALAVMRRGSAQRPRDAGNVLLRELSANDIVIESVDFVSDEPPERFTHSWQLVTPITRHEVSGELCCRVMMNAQCWVVAGVIGPDRATDSDAWMRNKRVLDVATATLELDRAMEQSA